MHWSRRWQSTAPRNRDRPDFLRQRERFYEGLHKAGLTD
jgi:hypothetical protein